LGRDQALAANILVRTTHTKHSNGPLLSLALEISPTRALAHYCYFPINLRNQGQQAYFLSLAKNGLIRLAFIAGREVISRNHQLLPTQLKQLTEMHSKAVDALEGCANYKFSDVVDEFEKTTRIPQFFERAISGEEISKTLASLTARADQLPTEKRRLAHDIVHGIADVLKNRYGDKVNNFMLDLSRLSWKWRKRSSVKITERTYEEGTEAFHSRRKSSHPEAASCGQSASLGAV